MGSSRQELVEDILRRHLAEEDKRIVSAGDVALCVRSSFALRCEKFAPDYERDLGEYTEFDEVLKESATIHQGEIIQAETIAMPYKTIEDEFRLVVESMAAGEALIGNALLISRSMGMLARPHYLVRVPGKSVFGDYQYRILTADIAIRIKRDRLIRSAFSNLLLSQIQQSTTPEIIFIDGHDNEQAHSFSDLEDELDEFIRLTRRIVAGDVTPRPVYGETPAPWGSYGDRLAEEIGDVTLLPGIKSLRDNLNEAGYHTIGDIAQADEKDLATVRGIGPKTAKQHILKAKAIHTGECIVKEEIELPVAPIEIYLDMEVLNKGSDLAFRTELGDVYYLIGVVVWTDYDNKYLSFFAEKPSDEETCWREFCDLVGSTRDFVMYCWTSAEKSYLKDLIKRYGAPPGIVDKLDSSLHDLSRLAKRAVAFPTKSDGLKDIANSLNFSWRIVDFDGKTTSVRYHDFLDSGSKDTEARGEILVYNEDDCRAMMQVKNYLAGLSHTDPLPQPRLL